MNLRFYLLLSLVVIFTKYSTAQTTSASIAEKDTVVQTMNEIEEKFKKQIDYYTVLLSKNGRRMKITGYDNKVGSDNLNYPFKVSQDKTKVKKNGVKIRNVEYFSYNTALFKDLTILKSSKILAFRKTEIDEKTISAKYTLPDKTIQYVLNGSYYRSKSKNKKYKAYIYN
ncbi:hypothetical protein GXP67_35600 [Rhodocytophaga rosea]|uniref:Uncharacterized protein n=1 Tax=Rhodocytophaga rosea TaxID=2704465 RepID=A0A6C0GTW4_9BACT|nr:hypothetical protein [Rhodocytophaga rosea]QHT71619.1 hypothetical protein GXP67_35600 [Rhodocytophaga rosea]